MATPCLSVGNGEPLRILEQEGDFKNTPTSSGSAALSLLTRTKEMSDPTAIEELCFLKKADSGQHFYPQPTF